MPHILVDVSIKSTSWRIQLVVDEESVVNKQITEAATTFAEAMDTDVLIYAGPLERGYDYKLLDLLAGMQRRTNVLLLLCSGGGNPDAAYRIARGLQDNYKKFTVLLAGRCKSAGTLLVLGAHEIAMTDHAELGPLDVQLGKKDELFELDSGLTVLNALTELESKAFELFEKTMFRIKLRSQGSVTFKTATHIATELAKGIVEPIMAQIDPMHVGEVSRALRIGKEYGDRLSNISNNLLEGSLDQLVEGYPSHGFVIDRKEAEGLFVNVRDATDEENSLIKLKPLSGTLRMPGGDGPILAFLSDTRKEAVHDASDAQNAGEGELGTGTGDSPNEAVTGGEGPSEEVLGARRKIG
jgi:hypothetical protein